MTATYRGCLSYWAPTSLKSCVCVCLFFFNLLYFLVLLFFSFFFSLHLYHYWHAWLRGRKTDKLDSLEVIWCNEQKHVSENMRKGRCSCLRLHTCTLTWIIYQGDLSLGRLGSIDGIEGLAAFVNVKPTFRWHLCHFSLNFLPIQHIWQDTRVIYR